MYGMPLLKNMDIPAVLFTAVCSEAFWLVFRSLFERVPKPFRTRSEAFRNKPAHSTF